MSMLTYQQIDDALLAYPKQDEWLAAEFAAFWGTTVWEASCGLQYYKKVQAKGKTKHILVPQSYGRRAIWRKADINVTSGHIVYIWRDAFNRLARDANWEVSPSSRRLTPSQYNFNRLIMDGLYQQGLAMMTNANALIAANNANADLSKVAPAVAIV